MAQLTVAHLEQAGIEPPKDAAGAARVMGVDELVDQARLAHPGLAHYRDHLAVASASTFQGLLQSVKLRLPPDKPRQSPRRRGLEAAASGGDTRQLTDRDGLGQPLDGDGPQGVDLDQAIHQAERRGRQQDTARVRELFHAGGQVRGLADC